MTDCPECGAYVPSDGRFCPECGTDVTAVSGGHSQADHPQNNTEQRQAAQPPQQELQRRPRGGQPAGGHQHDQYAGHRDQPAAQSRPQDHKFLLGGVVTLSLIGFVEGLAQALYPEWFLELIEQEGLGLEGELTADLFLFTGIIGVIVSLAVIGATAYFYREGAFRKWYFWLLIGSGVAGFFLVGSLFLTVLVAFGIYGLISVMD